MRSVVPVLALVALVQARPAAEGRDDGPIRARYVVDLAGRSAATYTLPAGRWTIRRVVWLPEPDLTDAWRSVRLRFVWDGDEPEAAGVDLPLGLLLTDDRGDRPTRYQTGRSMPYRRGGRLLLDAEAPVRGVLRLDLEPGGDMVDERGYFRAAVDDETERAAEGADGDEPSIRCWYDDEPGPAAGSGDRIGGPTAANPGTTTQTSRRSGR